MHVFPPQTYCTCSLLSSYVFFFTYESRNINKSTYCFLVRWMCFFFLTLDCWQNSFTQTITVNGSLLRLLPLDQGFTWKHFCKVLGFFHSPVGKHFEKTTIMQVKFSKTATCTLNLLSKMSCFKVFLDFCLTWTCWKAWGEGGWCDFKRANWWCERSIKCVVGNLEMLGDLGTNENLLAYKEHVNFGERNFTGKKIRELYVKFSNE